ncbi:adat1 [Symbiodinium sp. CCMP2592]|nr:adat1 [Symbiodinium sp. CCMP2592]
MSILNAAPEGPSAGEISATISDRIAQAVLSRYDELPGRGKPQGRSWTVLAGIVAEKPGGHLQVLALATGTRCLGVAAMTTGNGQVLHDCHAEALCRRVFHRFLLADMLCAANAATPDTVAVLLKRVHVEELRFAVQDNVRLHFYVSALPCGQCALLPLSSSSEGSLARKLREEDAAAAPAPVCDRNRTGAKPSHGMPTDPKADGVNFHRDGVLRYKSGRSDTRPDSRTVCYSCSDKICRWNHVGWQGALLSRLIEAPIYMQSVVIGGALFDEGFVRDALFDRAASPSTSAHAPLFCYTHVPFQSSREAAEAIDADCKVSTAGLSIVWAATDMPSTKTSDLVSLPRRSISSKTSGFYDILIGHTGQRQGLRSDHVRRNDLQATTSWVSPLCKKLTAQDMLQAVLQILQSEEALIRWLASTETSVSGRPTKRRRIGCSEDNTALVHYPTYAWFKEAATSETYRSSRTKFHSVEPFVHWSRKQRLVFLSEMKGVDAFEVEVSKMDAFAQLPECCCPLTLAQPMAAVGSESGAPIPEENMSLPSADAFAV